MNKERKSHVLRQTFGLTLVVLLLAGCGGTSTQPTATPAPEEATIVSTTAPSPTATATIEPTTPPTPTTEPTMPPPTAATEPTAPVVLRGDYLGQTPPGLTPEIFAPGIVSTDVYEAAGAFSPDGKEFVFTRDRDSRLWFTRLEEHGWTTPQLAPFSHDSIEFEPHITPDGQRLYYSSFRPLPDGSGGGPHTWFVEKTASGWGEPQLFDWPVGDGHAMYSTVSNDKTLYTTSSYAIYKAEWVDGQYAQPVRLGQEINGLPIAAHPYIAPDGHYLIFDAQVGGSLKSSIFISFRQAGGSWSTPQKMGDEINATETEICASVSPDGKYLFFSREVDGKRDIYWVDAKIIDDYRPATLPSSTGEEGLIAFSSSRHGDDNFEIYVIDVKGAGERRLTDNDSHDVASDWSPDATQLAFMAFRDGNSEIYVMNGDGSDQRQLTHNGADDYWPAWSPDGAHLVFSSMRDGNEEIYVMDVQVALESTGDGGQQRLTDNRSSDTAPVWSPDGAQIVFASQRDGNYEIYAMDADGDNARRLTSDPALDSCPAWSPDGTRIAFSSRRGGDYEIYVMAADGSDVTPLPIGDGDGWCPRWSPDGAQIAFYSYRPGRYRDGAPNAIYVVDVDGSNLQALTAPGETSNWHPAWRPRTDSPAPLSLQALTPENAAGVTQLRVLEWPEGSVSSLQCTVDFTLDQRMVAAACFDEHIPFWDVETGQLAHTIQAHTREVVSLDFSPDGHTFATGGRDNLIQLWNVESGERLRTLSGHEGGVWSVAFSADGQTLASASMDKTVRLWDVETGALLRTFTGHRSMALSVAYSPDGYTLASGGVDHTVRLWEVETGELLRTHEEPRGNVGHVAFSPDGSILAAGSDDDLIRLWEVETGELLRTLEGHEGWVNGVAFSPDGYTLASGSHDTTVGLWDVSSGQLLRRLQGHEDTVLRVAFSPDGRMVASVSWDGTVRLWGVVGESE